MNLRQAAEQALEALEQSAPWHNPMGTVRQEMDSAITADGRCLGWDGNEINTAA